MHIDICQMSDRYSWQSKLNQLTIAIFGRHILKKTGKCFLKVFAKMVKIPWCVRILLLNAVIATSKYFLGESATSFFCKLYLVPHTQWHQLYEFKYYSHGLLFSVSLNTATELCIVHDNSMSRCQYQTSFPYLSINVHCITTIDFILKRVEMVDIMHFTFT